MGLLDWFKSRTSNIKIHPDKIWLSQEAKRAGIAGEVTGLLGEKNGPLAVFLVAHFADCLADLRTLADEKGFDPDRVLPVLAGDLHRQWAAIDTLGESSVIVLVFGERHPMTSQDEALVESAEGLPCRCRVVRHICLDDAVIRVFAGDRIKRILKGLGMKQDQALESGVVSRQIKGGQRKIAKHCTGDTPAESAEAWLRLNCPDLWSMHMADGTD